MLRKQFFKNLDLFFFTKKRSKIFARNQSKSSSDYFGVPEIDFSRLENSKNGDINLIKKLQGEIDLETDCSKKLKLIKSLLVECNKFPNLAHKAIEEYGQEPKVVKTVKNNEYDFKLKTFDEMAKKSRGARLTDMSTLTGQRSYYFIGDLADLEHALVKYTLTMLKENKFNLISVPDILPSHVIERCGMSTTGTRNQVYFLDERHGDELCLSGTAEMALAGYLHDTVFDIKELPILLTACSRCYRAEISGVVEEKGIYRVHHFTKVEMFGVTTPENSDTLLQEFLKLQEEHFLSLGLDYQVLDMPKCELGSPASRKFDIEAWLPGREMFGEISSCSNCTDYQSQRLNIKYKDEDGTVRHAHTINGTACAVPRLILAITETHQQSNGCVNIPEVLRPYLDDKDTLKRQSNVPKLNLTRKKKDFLKS